MRVSWPWLVMMGCGLAPLTASAQSSGGSGPLSPLPGGTAVGKPSPPLPAVPSAAPPAGTPDRDTSRPVHSPEPTVLPQPRSEPSASLVPVPMQPSSSPVTASGPVLPSGPWAGPWAAPRSTHGFPYLPGGGIDCCGPLGSDGPIGQEYYVRFGLSNPFGNDLLPRNLERGWQGQIGGRAQFFDPAGDAAWAIDAHVTYTYNDATNADIITLEGEPVTLRTLHRTAVGLGVGRDWFFNQPGLFVDTWDGYFRVGIDAGGRWGAGHCDFDTPFEDGGYRRRYDVFGQAFAGIIGTMEVPMGGWIWLIGGRIEGVYTFSDLLPREASFYELNIAFMLGVRY